MIKSALLFVLFYSTSDEDYAEIVYNNLRFQARGQVDWTLSPRGQYWQFDWSLNDPYNKRSYEKARIKQGNTPMPYGSI